MKTKPCLLSAALLWGCGSSQAPAPAGQASTSISSSDDAGTLPLEARGCAPTPRLIQPGTQLFSLAPTTDDGYALYWDDGSVYATLLYPGAPRTFVVAAAFPPAVLVRGRVAMIWTHQGQSLAGTPAVVSPLVVWTWRHMAMAKMASAASWGPAFNAFNAGAAVSPSSDEVIFLSNVSSDGNTGDVVRAAVDFSRTTTLVSGISVNPSGSCPPHVGYDRTVVRRDTRDRAEAIVLSCAGTTATVASLSKWTGDTQVSLSTNLLAGGWWDGDAFGQRVLSFLPDSSEVVFEADGTSTVIAPNVNFGWVNDDGTVFSNLNPTATTGVILRTTFSPALHTELVANVSPTTVFWTSHLAPGFPYYDVSTSAASPDGRLAILSTTFATTGSRDGVLVDLTQTNATPTVFQATPITFNLWNIFTSDSTHVIYDVPDSTGSSYALQIAARDGTNQQISSFRTLPVSYALEDGRVAFNDQINGAAIDPLATTDLELADVRAQPASGTKLASDVYLPFFPTAGGRAVVYTSDSDPTATGLFVISVH